MKYFSTGNQVAFENPFPDPAGSEREPDWDREVDKIREEAVVPNRGAKKLTAFTGTGRGSTGSRERGDIQCQ